MNEVDARQELVDRLREVYSHGGARKLGAVDLRERAKRGSLDALTEDQKRERRNRLARERRAALREKMPAKKRGRKRKAKIPGEKKELPIGLARWHAFVQAVRDSYPGISYKEALKRAKDEGWKDKTEEEKIAIVGLGLSGGARRKKGVPRLPICAPSRGVCQPAGLAAWNDFLKRWFAYYNVHHANEDWEGKEWSDLSRKDKIAFARLDYEKPEGLPEDFPRGSGMSGGRRGRRRVIRRARAPRARAPRARTQRRRRGGVLVGEIGLNRGGVLVDHFYDRGGAAGGVLIDQAYN